MLRPRTWRRSTSSRGSSGARGSPFTGRTRGRTSSRRAPGGEAPRRRRPRPPRARGRAPTPGLVPRSPRGAPNASRRPEDGQGVCEVFVQSLDVEADAIGRMVSLALRTGADPRDVIEQLWRVQSREVALDRSTDGTVVRITTVAQGVALALGRTLYGPGFRPDQVFPMADRLPAPRMGNGNGHATGGPEGSAGADPPESLEVQQPLLTFAGVCPDCGSSLVYENGCSHCRLCGYSKC